MVRSASPSESIFLKFTHRAEGVWSLFQDRTRQEAEFAPTGMCLWHVLKQGPHHLGSRTAQETLCKTETRRLYGPLPFVKTPNYCISN